LCDDDEFDDDDDDDEQTSLLPWTWLCTELALAAVVFIALIIAAGILCIGVVFIRRFNSPFIST